MAKYLMICTALCMACAGCEDSRVKELQSENADLEGQVSALTEKLENTRAAIADVQAQSEKVKSAADDLESEASSFDEENWREVVPRVQSASDDVSTAQTELESSIEELDSVASED